MLDKIPITKNSYILLALLIMVFIILIVLIVMLFLKERKELSKKYQKAIETESKLYRKILEINSRYSFYDIQSEYPIDIHLDSKSRFDRYNLDDLFESTVARNKDFYLILKLKTTANLRMKELYDKEIAEAGDYIDEETAQKLHLKWKRLHKLERELTVPFIQYPTTKVSIRCRKTYTSPQGRNFYEDYKLYPITCIKETLDAIDKKIAARETETSQRKYERSLMTDSLRYDVMKRDGFKCVLCGRSASDGVKLHVDHIRPVSKGGKTIMSNLRTLCINCNLGKSAKYDYDGIN